MGGKEESLIFMKKIPLTQGKFALVDDEDFKYLNRFKWQSSSKVSGSDRAFRSLRIGNTIVDIAMETFLIEIPLGATIIHKDNNGLNNQKANILIGQSGQKNHHSKKGKLKKGKKYTSLYKGVYKENRNKIKCWRAYISINTNDPKKKKQIKLGSFSTEQEAALAYNRKAKELYGEFAYQNKLL